MNQPIQPLMRAFLGNLMIACTRCYEGYDYVRKPYKANYFKKNPY